MKIFEINLNVKALLIKKNILVPREINHIDLEMMEVSYRNWKRNFSTTAFKSFWKAHNEAFGILKFYYLAFAMLKALTLKY